MRAGLFGQGSVSYGGTEAIELDRLDAREVPPLNHDKNVERRRSAREGAVRNWAVLEWREGGELRSSAGRVIDISPVGLLLDTEILPPLHRAAWVRLEGPVATDWVRAVAVRRHGMGATGMAFADRCPFDFYHGAALGIDFAAIAS